MHLSPYQAVMLWDQLVSAYYGKNKFGGHTAEIYLFTCMEHSPIYQIKPSGRMGEEARTRACFAIHELCMLFQQHYECTILVCDADLDQLLDAEFDQHVHLTVKPKHERKQVRRTDVPSV